MKKIIFNILFLSMIVLLVACGTNTDPQNEAAQDAPAENQEKKDTQDSKKETIRIGTDAAYAPFEAMSKGEIVGFDVDFITAVMEEAGYEFEIKNTGWEPLFQSVKNGDVHLGISAITITDERKETYDFSIPYFAANQNILIPNDSDIKSYEDLKDKVIGVQTGTTGDIKAEELLGEKSSNIKKYETTPLAIMALNNQEVDAVIADNGVVRSYVKNNPDQNLVALSDKENFSPEYYGVMFKMGNDELRNEVNEAISTVIDNGTYEEIYQTWFGSSPDLESLKQQQQQ